MDTNKVNEFVIAFMNQFKHSRAGRVIAITTGFLTAVLMLGGTAVLPASAEVSVADLQKQIADLTALIAQLQGAGAGATTAPATSYSFSRNLKLGDTGADVLALQKVLNSNPSTQVSLSGAGSPGLESTYFGAKTKVAVAKWQVLNLGLAVGTGFVGPMSLAKLNAMGGTVVPPTTGGGTVVPPTTGGGTVILPSGSGLTIERLNKDVTFIAIPTNSTAMTFGQFKLSAGSSEARITGMTIKRSGLGSKNDFDEVWLVVDGRVYGNEQSITTGDVAVFNLASDPIVLAAGTSATLEVMGSMATGVSAGMYNTLSISKVDSNVAVNATLPLDGPQTTTASQTVAQVTLTVQGSAKNVPVGSMQTELGRFQLSVTSTNDQSVVLKRLTLRNQGTANTLSKILANAAIKVGSDTISSKVDYAAGGDRITFTLGENGYVMKNGQTQSLTVVADVVSAEVSDTVIFQLERAFDLVGYEVATGVGIRVLGSDAGGATDPASDVDFKTYTLQTGKINFATGNSSSRSIGAGISDAVLLDGKLTVGTAFRADSLVARVVSGTDTAADTEANLNTDLNNVSLKIDGVTIKTVDVITAKTGGTSAIDLTGATGDYYNFNSKFTVEVGEHKVQVTANIRSGATANDAIKLQIFSGDLSGAEYVKTGDNVPSTEITGQMLGSLTTIKAATLTATRNDGFSGQTIVGGVQGVKLFKFTLDANDSSDIHVTGMTFVKNAASTYTTSNVTNMRLFVGGKEVASSIDLSNGNFSNVDFNVPKSGQAQVELVIDTNTTSTAGETLEIDLTDVNAFDSQGNTASVLEGGAALTSSNVLASSSFTVNTGGSFTLTLDGDSPKEDILIGDGGTVWYPVATYRLTAKDDNVKLTDLYFGNGTTVADVIATTTASDARVKTLGIFDKNGVLKGSKSLSSGVVHFDLGKELSDTGTGAILVPNNDSAKIYLKVQLNDVKDAGNTGALLRLVLDPTAGTGSTGVTAQSASTGADLASSSIIAARSNTGSLATGPLRATSTASDFFAIRRTKPALASVAQVSTEKTFIGGTSVPVYRFTVSANSREDVAWKGIKLEVKGRLGGSDLATTTNTSGNYGVFVSGVPGTANGIAIASTTATTKYVRNFRLYEASTGQEVQNQGYKVEVDWSTVLGAGEVAFIMNDQKEEVVSAGTSKTYEVKADVSGVSSNGDFLDVAYKQEANDARTAAYNVSGTDPDEVDGVADSTINMTAHSVAAISPYAFLWSDNSGSPHSSDNNNATAIQRDWTNDRYVKFSGTSWNRSATGF